LQLTATVDRFTFLEYALILKLLCVALLDELHSGLECDVLWCDVPNTLTFRQKIADNATNCLSVWT